MAQLKTTFGEIGLPGSRRTSAKVISIDVRSPKNVLEQKSESRAEPVTQARLAKGFRLHLEEMRISRALLEFRLQLEADLAAGAQIEGGDLLYDSDLKIIRRDVGNAMVGG